MFSDPPQSEPLDLSVRKRRMTTTTIQTASVYPSNRRRVTAVEVLAHGNYGPIFVDTKIATRSSLRAPSCHSNDLLLPVNLVRQPPTRLKPLHRQLQPAAHVATAASPSTAPAAPTAAATTSTAPSGSTPSTITNRQSYAREFKLMVS